ncbi:hypothetical protein TTHERM_00002740 (macronuclear) [Tetrahymena thermophila SB210]|uniref:Uncharacterized protein n=1 Tax=Tetrahymena thermophila (strain SB210) TaxID=312017 RepID=Q22SG2_TETTS|nr:hypothetical protein TTHERM_00002740 [Tetrahymena thermophila SB210]EAR87810.2 hypothetical protein TTHERM_00002740 [Tetrahymena thermophila SB210]|eukprot:XP_001008055.2 hypothetical protein TTHERM_00002740 [Tetrahymena thermophila SB210]
MTKLSTYQTGISVNQNGILVCNNNICNQNQVIQNSQTQANLTGYSNDYTLSQSKCQQSYVQDFQLEKNDNIVINDVNFYEKNKRKSRYKKEEQIDYLDVKMNKSEDFDTHVSRQVRCSFSTELIDRNNVDRNSFEIICSIGNKTFQTNETQMEEESSNNNEQIAVQNIQNSLCLFKNPHYQNVNQNDSPQVQQNAKASPQLINEQKLLQFQKKKEFLNHNILLNSLKQEFLRFYDLKDEKKLVHQIYNDLSQKVNEIKSGEFTQKSTLQSKQLLDYQVFTFKQCVYTNLNSDISKQFVNHCGQINLNNNQNKEDVLNTQFYNNYISRDDDNNQISISNNSNNDNSQNVNELINLNEHQAPSSLFQKFFCLKPKSTPFLKNFDFSEIRLNQPKKTLKIRNKKENSSYIKNSQFHNLNKLFMYNILSMFRIDALNNLNLSEIIIQELSKIIQRLKISSQRKHKKQNQGVYNYFTHSHYNILFLKINDMNIHQIKNSPLDLDLHQQCFNIDLSNDVPEIEIAYINLIKEINFQIFMVNIRENELIDDGTESKQNIRIKYTLKAINGIKKISKGNLIKKF